tara:strand:+ start:616 stop:891 length:276 start_codon:yes stop_codon:yes gene_type:complete
MKKFNQFSEDADKVAALRARQKAAVAKYKTTDSKPSKPKESESEVHHGDIATDDLRQKRAAVKQARVKASARKAEIQQSVQRELQRQKGDK